MNSRAGTKFVGFSKQTGRSFPPRLIPFQFSINQGLALEFGHQYMRVIADGGFVVETPIAIGNVTQARPAVVSFGAEGATAATPIDTGVTFSYAPGDLITLLGGTALTPAVLEVTASQLVAIQVANPGSGYAVSDTITLAGGTSSVSAVATVATLRAVAASGSFAFAFNPSDGNAITLDGTTWTFKTVTSSATETAIQPTLAGTLTQLIADLNASSDINVSTASYSTDGVNLFVTFKTTGTGGNSYTLASGGAWAVASGGTLSGGAINGVGTVTITTAGVFSALPANGMMTESATSGGGSGASFQTAVFGPNAVSINNPGAYSVVPANPVGQASTTGIGVGAKFTMTFGAVAAFNNGDWLFISGVEGMTELNGNTYVVAGATATSVQLLDVYGNQVDSTGFPAYTGEGTVSRIYTLATPYNEQDLKWLKFTQSADVMTLCCVNQDTNAEYVPQDLQRFTDTDWVFFPVIPQTTVTPPVTTSAAATSSGSTNYAYQVTAVSPIDGTESIASPIAEALSAVDISATAGAVVVRWSQVANVNSYNIYKAAPGFEVQTPVGALYGYAGSAYGGQFNDTNIIPDFSQVPPLHQNPFAGGQVIGATIISPGSGYPPAATTATVASGTGSGAVLEPVVVTGNVVAIIVLDAGSGYQPGDTITISGAGGSGATATLQVGAQHGTYPSVPAYFQERRVFAHSHNNPDTYWMSQPGAFGNFDIRIPTIDTDAITGSPWAVQVNGIQFMVQTAGGLLVMTGLSAWLLVGAGTFATNVQPISPASQDANPQPFTGCSPNVPPIKVNYDVLYVTAKGSLYYDLPYQLYVLTEPIDLTQYSTHLFVGHTILEHAWCEQPYKTLWAVRDDGILLCLTYLKAEQLAGWTRSDTNGLFASVCAVTEPPVDALYAAVQRFPGTETAYMIERMDDRIWSAIEDTWCVDAGLALAQPTPNATLTANSTNGVGAITGATMLQGGSGYSAGTTVTVIDNKGQGPGIGAIGTPTIVGGVITGIAFGTEGSGYINPAIEISDPAGTGFGAIAAAILDTSAIFTASGAVFSVGSVGSIIRMGGGIATITTFTDAEHVIAKITQPISAVLPNAGTVIPQAPGTWTMTAPVSTISGLNHLIGATVTGLADGHVITPRVVRADGSIVLDAPASAVTVGLGFQAQFQSVYVEGAQQPLLGQRKVISAVSVLLEASKGVLMGANQVDGSTLSPPQVAPVWSGMKPVADFVPGESPPKPYNSTVTPLYTGFRRLPVINGAGKNGQVALQQDLPLPLNLLALIPEGLLGDTPEQMVQKAPPQQQQAMGRG